MLENSSQVLGQAQAMRSMKGPYECKRIRKQTFSYIIKIMAFWYDLSSQICLFLGFLAGFSQVCPVHSNQQDTSALYFGRDNKPCL